MTPTVSPTTLRRLDVQGFDCVDVNHLARVAPWLRMTFGMCAGLAIISTILASSTLLSLLAMVALIGALSPVHPFDLIYNHGVRHLTRSPVLPTRGMPSRFACGLGAVWLVITVWMFRTGPALAGYALGGVLSAIATFVATTDICIPSLFFRTLFGWPSRRIGTVTEAAR